MPDPHENLFESTKMSFGGHLEELRRCLMKALFGLAIGVGIGLYFADYLVIVVGSPITKALESFYANDVQVKYREWKETYDGESPWSEENIEKMVNDERLLFEIQYIHPGQVGQALQHRYPSSASIPKMEAYEFDETDTTRPSKASGLVPIFLWHKNSEDGRIALKGLAAEEGFMTWLKVGFFAGLTLASPWVFYQIWLFVAAGLYPNEKRYVHLFLPISIGLFVAGAYLAFFHVFHYVLNFLFTFNASMGISPEPRVSEWIKFAMILPLGFGISFQLPLVMLFLERIHIFTVEIYLAKWRIAVLVIAIMSMILTPADPMSMLLMFVPLTILFFGGILLCKYLPKSQSPFAGEEER